MSEDTITDREFLRTLATMLKAQQHLIQNTMLSNAALLHAVAGRFPELEPAYASYLETAGAHAPIVQDTREALALIDALLAKLPPNGDA